MAARIFISYRSADGADKATALARDLGRVFGHDAVFLDKDDLAGGSAWRAEIGRTLQQRPVLLLLLTPQLLDAVGADGRRRIDDPADPVRREFEAALEAGAQVIPVLCDGMAAAPSELPAPFDRIGELTWRKLRAYDWAHDVQRLVADLGAHGVPAIASPPGAAAVHAATPAPSARRAGLVGGALMLGAAALVGWWVLRPAAPAAPAALPAGSTPVLAASSPASNPASSPVSAAAVAAPTTSTASPAAPPAATTSPSPQAGGAPSGATSTAARAPAAAASAKPSAAQLTSDLSGRWAARLWQGERVVVVIQQTGAKISLASEPVPISDRADWAEYRQFWRDRTGSELNAVMYRGQGQITNDPGVARAIDIALQVLPSPGGREPVDGGNLSATLSADGLRLSGKIWKNGAQAEQGATLTRMPVQNPAR